MVGKYASETGLVQHTSTYTLYIKDIYLFCLPHIVQLFNSSMRIIVFLFFVMLGWPRLTRIVDRSGIAPCRWRVPRFPLCGPHKTVCNVFMVEKHGPKCVCVCVSACHEYEWLCLFFQQFNLCTYFVVNVGNENETKHNHTQNDIRCTFIFRAALLHNVLPPPRNGRVKWKYLWEWKALRLFSILLTSTLLHRSCSTFGTFWVEIRVPCESHQPFWIFTVQWRAFDTGRLPNILPPIRQRILGNILDAVRSFSPKGGSHKLIPELVLSMVWFCMLF